MLIKTVTWTQLKTVAIARDIPVQWLDYTEKYWIAVIDGSLVLETNLDKVVDAADVLDFETIFKNAGNARLATALKPFANADGFRARFKGISAIVPFGVTTNIDYTLAEERWIDGVEILHVDAAMGDTANFQIVHPTYGVVDTFGTSWNIDSTVGKQGAVVLNYPAKLAAGLTIRCAYMSVGTTTNVWVGINLRLHKKT